MTENVQITLPSRIESVDEAAAAAERFAKDAGLADDIIFAIDLAVRESVANAVKHGNKFDESKAVEVSLAETAEEIEIKVRDYGSGFRPEDIPDPTDRENLLKANGRGILFMRSFMDFDLINVAIIPMFLFSATFFPLSTYPGPVQWLVQATPLYQGVALERALMLGDVGWSLLGHAAYLVAMGLVGVVGTSRRIQRLLLT